MILSVKSVISTGIGASFRVFVAPRAIHGRDVPSQRTAAPGPVSDEEASFPLPRARRLGRLLQQDERMGQRRGAATHGRLAHGNPAFIEELRKDGGTAILRLLT